jgi:hypothetical protein
VADLFEDLSRQPELYRVTAGASISKNLDPVRRHKTPGREYASV